MDSVLARGRRINMKTILFQGDSITDAGRDRDYVRTLERHDYQGCLDLEINDSIYWEDPHTSIDRTCQYLRAFLPEQP